MRYAAILLRSFARCSAARPAGHGLQDLSISGEHDPAHRRQRDDWKMVPDSYAIGMDQLVDDTNKDRKPDPKDLDVKVKVGWVKGLNRLYFLYEAYDNYWDFAQAGLAQRHLRGGGGWRSLRRAADRALPAHQGTERPRRALLHARRAGAELPHHDAAGGQGLGAGLGLQLPTSRTCPTPTPRTTTTSSPGESGKLIAGVLDHAVRLCGLRRPAARGGIGADGEQADRPGVGGARLRRCQQRDSTRSGISRASTPCTARPTNWWRSG